jgi:hypothetical protein
VDAFLQAVVTAERRLTAIAVSFLTHMVQDKILSSLSSACLLAHCHPSLARIPSA